MGSFRRWRVSYFDRAKRVERDDFVMAEGDRIAIMERLKQKYPGRRIHSVELAALKDTEQIG